MERKLLIAAIVLLIFVGFRLKIEGLIDINYDGIIGMIINYIKG